MRTGRNRNRLRQDMRACRAEADRLRKLEAIVNSMADGLIVFDMSGNVLEMNPAALRIHRYESLGATLKRCVNC